MLKIKRWSSDGEFRAVAFLAFGLTIGALHYPNAQAADIDHNISLPMVHTSQKDPSWAKIFMVGPKVGGTYVLYPDRRTFAQKGCYMSSVAMALQTLGAFPSPYRPTPPAINQFFADKNLMVPRTDEDRNQFYEPIWGGLNNWLLDRTVKYEARPWPSGREELDAWLLASEEALKQAPTSPDYCNNPGLGWLKKIPLLELVIDSMGIQLRHVVMVKGWDKDKGSYIVHDPLQDSQLEAAAYSFPPPEPLCRTGFGFSYYTKLAHETLSSLYGSLRGVEEDGLSAIYRIVWLSIEDELPGPLLRGIVLSPVELFITDPDGKSGGMDPSTGAIVSNNDTRYYALPDFDALTDAGNDVPKVIEFLHPKNGSYNVRLTGTADGPFKLMFQSTAGSWESSGTIHKGETQKYELKVSSERLMGASVSTFQPTAKLTADAGHAQVGTSLSFSGAASSDPDGRIVSYAWNLGDGARTAGVRVEHAFAAPGVYTVTLTVTDDGGSTASTSKEVEISAVSALPTAKIATADANGEYSLAPFIALASNDTIDRAFAHMAAIGIDPNNANPSTWTWRWDFGDGSDPVVSRSCYLGQDCRCAAVSCAIQIPKVSDVTHEYRNPGRYTVSVVFNNGVGNSAPATAEIEVLPALKRINRSFSLGESCLATTGNLRLAGRTDATEVGDLWNGGFALGRSSLDEWLGNNRGRSLLLENRQTKEAWIMKAINVKLPDLSFDYTTALPADVGPGDYRAILDWGTDWSQFGQPPLKLSRQRLNLELALTAPLGIPCPEPGNLPPIADAGGPYQAATDQRIALDGRRSSDPDGDSSNLTFTWFITGGDSAIPQPPLTGPTPAVSMKTPGTYVVTLVVTDENGTESALTPLSPKNWTTLTVTGQAIDTTPPVISKVSAIPSLLWPPNHRMVPVTINYDVADNATTPSCTLKVSSNEPSDGVGGRNHHSDWSIVDAHHVTLRAERTGHGNGRKYTIDIQCVDQAGNKSAQQIGILVPHDQSAMDKFRGNCSRVIGRVNGFFYRPIR